MDVDFYWPCICIGNTIDAIRFASTNKAYLLLNGFPDTDSFNLSGSLAGEEDRWAEELHDLYSNGQVPFSGAISSIRFVDNVLLVATVTGKRYRIRYEKAYVFTTNITFGLEEYLTKQFLYNKVVDWHDAIKGGEESYSFDDALDDCIKKVAFYPSNRIDGRSYYDILSVSHLSDDQLQSHDHSDTATRFKIQKMAHMLGKKLVLTFWKRDVFKIYNIVYNNNMPSNIEWMGGTIEAHDD